MLFRSEHQQSHQQPIYQQTSLSERSQGLDEIAPPPMPQRYATARTFINNPELMAAAVHIGEKVYKTPYTEPHGLISANFTYTCSDGTVINRPNHNMANIMRTLYYLQPVLEYLSRNGNDEAQNLLATIDDNEIQKILFLQLFYCSGRTNEVGFAQSPEISMRHRADAGAHFKEYFAAQPNKTPFKDMEEVEHYAEILRDCYYIFDGKIKAKEFKDKAVSMILVFCHSLDLPRCYSGYNWQRQIYKFNKYSRIPNNRDLQKLLLYAQRCIIATGDMLCTQYQTQKIHGVHEPTSFYFQLKETGRRLMHAGSNWFVTVAKRRDDGLYKEACRTDAVGIGKTSETLSRVVEPVFFGGSHISPPYGEAEILKIIESGNAASRSFNGSPFDTSFRFEVEQLTNPEYVRPLRGDKLARRHDLRVDLTSGNVTQLPEREYRSVQDQKRVASPQDYVPATSVSRQEDRGKPKNTAYQKKCSYSLVPKTGIFSIFKGRLQDRIFNKYITVGFLHDTNRMNLHGEKYVWSADVSSSGISGYFWLARQDGVRPVTHSRLQEIRDRSHCRNLEELKGKVNDPTQHINFNEFLGSGSVDSLAAIYTISYSAKNILAALYVQCVLRRDYGIERDIVILDGKNKPRVVREDELKQVWIQVNQELQHGWGYWFKSIFYKPQVQRLVVAINSATNNVPFGDESHTRALPTPTTVEASFSIFERRQRISSLVNIVAKQDNLPEHIRLENATGNMIINEPGNFSGFEQTLRNDEETFSESLANRINCLAEGSGTTTLSAILSKKVLLTKDNPNLRNNLLDIYAVAFLTGHLKICVLPMPCQFNISEKAKKAALACSDVIDQYAQRL